MEEELDEPPDDYSLFAPWRWEGHEQIGCGLSLVIFGFITAFVLFIIFGAIHARRF